MLTDERNATSAQTRWIAGAEQVEPSCLAAGKWLAGLRAWTTRGCFGCARHGQGRGPGARSGGDRQCHQPFELADFLAEAARALAVCGSPAMVGAKLARSREASLDEVISF